MPPYGEPKVSTTVSSGGSSIVLANMFSSPSVGDTFTVAGNAQVYTISSVDTTDLTVNKRVTVGFTPNLVANATDQVAVTFVTGSGDMEGVASFEDTAVVARGGNLFRSAGSASNWTRINVPVYGTVLVNGGSQTGSTLAIDGLTAASQAGDTFTVRFSKGLYSNSRCNCIVRWVNNKYKPCSCKFSC